MQRSTQSWLGWLKTDRGYWIVLSCGVAVYGITETIRTGNFLDQGFIHHLLITALLAGTFCIGLIFRQNWSRWVGIAWIAGMIALIAWHAHLHGLTGRRVFTLACGVGCIWILWQLPITKVQEFMKAVKDPTPSIRQRMAEVQKKLTSRRSWKVILLLRAGFDLDASQLSVLAKRAFGSSFQVIDREIDPVNAAFLPNEYPLPIVAGKAPVLLCHKPPHLLAVFLMTVPLLDYSTEEKRFYDVEHEPIDEHMGRIEIELLPHSGNSSTVPLGYKLTGRLAAELLDDRCVGVYLPEDERVLPMSPVLKHLLENGLPRPEIN